MPNWLRAPVGAACVPLMWGWFLVGETITDAFPKPFDMPWFAQLWLVLVYVLTFWAIVTLFVCAMFLAPPTRVKP